MAADEKEPKSVTWTIEDLVALGDVPARLPGRIHVASVYRWATKGCMGVRLKVVSMGRRRFTTARWLEEFAEAVEAARTEADVEVPKPALPARQRRSAIHRDAQVPSLTRSVLGKHGLGDAVPGDEPS